jgi:hypothetical protein
MSSIRRELFDALELLLINLDDPTLMLGVQDADLPVFRKRLTALRSLKDGASFSAIRTETALTRQQVSYFVGRLLVPAVDGRPLGLRALSDGSQRQRTFSDDAVSLGRPTPGALQTLFRLHPDLLQTMAELTLHGKYPDLATPMPRGMVTADVVHCLFLKLCDDKGIKAPNFPFVGELQGKRSLAGWMKSVRAKQTQEEHLAVMQAQRDPDQVRLAISQVYGRVEADAHSIAVNWNLRVPSLRGEGYIDVKTTRLWFIALRECRSGAVLGRSFAFGKNYSASDLLRAVNHALVPWKPLAVLTPTPS